MFKLGVGRNLVGGILIVLMRLGFFDYEGRSQALPERFDRSHTKSPCGVSSSRARSSIKTKTLVSESAPWSNSKGWNNKFWRVPLPYVWCAVAICFLERHCARVLYVHLITTLRGYSVLADRSTALSIRAFIQKPKRRALHHMARALKDQLLKGQTLAQSPQVYGCEINEDMIGRISRLTRRVGFKQCHVTRTAC